MRPTLGIEQGWISELVRPKDPGSTCGRPPLLFFYVENFDHEVAITLPT
jgi:hypothetical protein